MICAFFKINKLELFNPSGFGQIENFLKKCYLDRLRGCFIIVMVYMIPVSHVWIYFLFNKIPSKHSGST